MSSPKRTSLDAWILAKHSLDVADRRAVQSYQLDKIRDLIARARAGSRFYGQLYQGLDLPGSLEAFGSYPMTSARDLIERGSDLLSVHPGQVARIVTLETSGTTGASKRVYFTQADLDLTYDFFFHGMQTLSGPGDRVLILFPWAKPDSVGDLLGRALTDLGLEVFYAKVAEAGPYLLSGLDLVCGPASWVLEAAESNPGLKVRAVLTSSETLRPAMRARIMTLWGAAVFDHYGMTETGLGGAVECDAHQGMHIRENDLYFELIDGELLVTTLTRQGMPFIRYRTGDRGGITYEPCPCGSFIPRILWAERF